MRFLAGGCDDRFKAIRNGNSSRQKNRQENRQENRDETLASSAHHVSPIVLRLKIYCDCHVLAAS
jgi:hypothetical protein